MSMTTILAQYENFDDDGDTDSGVGSDRSDSTQSVTSSVLNYQFFYGRRFPSPRWGKCSGPNDETEQELMDMFHHLYLLISNNRLCLSPIASPTAILDVGTGTGTWALDIADQYPGAHVIAIDISPIQPGLVAPNLEFQMADCEEQWTFNHTFDLIHMRNLNGAISNWSQLLNYASQQLSPGGWLELVEIGDAVGRLGGQEDDNSALYHWQRLLHEAAALDGRPRRHGGSLGDDLRKVGLVEVQCDCIQIPIGPWESEDNNRELGIRVAQLLCGALEGMSLTLFVDVLGWPIQHFHALLAEVRNELVSGSRHLTCHIYNWRGRKP